MSIYISIYVFNKKNTVGISSGERFASHGDIFDCRGSSVLVDCIFVLVRI